MNWIQHLKASRPGAVGARSRRCAWLAWSCALAAGCVVESPPDELGAVQISRGQPVMGRSPASSVGPVMTTPATPGTNAPPSSAPTAGSTSSPMDPAGRAAPAAGGPATPPKAQDTAPSKPATPTAGTSAAPPVAGAAAGHSAAAGAGAPPATEPNGSTAPGTPPEDPGASTGPGMLTVAFMSVGPGGRYAPRNCGAVWIEDSSGKFVKTIERWTAIRERYLEKWTMASGGWGFSIFGGGTMNADQVDVVSAGTLSRHQMHMSTWNMKNVAGEVVPDGKYSVVVEVTEGTSGVGRVEFVKGPMAQKVDGKAPVFSNMTVTYSR